MLITTYQVVLLDKPDWIRDYKDFKEYEMYEMMEYIRSTLQTYPCDKIVIKTVTEE